MQKKITKSTNIIFKQEIFYKMSLSNGDTSKDLASIGQHCSLSDCNRLDFLPVKCELCGLMFCKEHYSLTAHNCDKFNSGKTANIANESQPFETFKCSFENCCNREKVKVNCEFCQLDFCMKHRLQVDHKCCKLSNPSDKNQSKYFHKCLFFVILDGFLLNRSKENCS